MKKLFIVIVLIIAVFMVVKPYEITIKQNDESYITFSCDIFKEKHFSIEKEENEKITHAFIISQYGLEIF